MATIKGMVYDSFGLPAPGRIIRVYRRDSGSLIGTTKSMDAVPDPDNNYSNVTLLLHMDGIPGSSHIKDSSPLNSQIVSYGGLALTNSDYKFGVSCLYFNGSGMYLDVPQPARPTSTEQFTLETFIKISTLPSSNRLYQIYSQHLSSTAHINFEIRPDGYLALWLGATSTYIISNTLLPIDQWVHVAISRTSAGIFLFQDGNLVASTTANPSLASSGTGRIGREGANLTTWDFKGYMDEFRITRGVGRYSSNFTPPTKQFYDPYYGNLTTGEYKIDIDGYTGEVNVLCLDDAEGNVYNDIVHRVLI